MRGGGKGRREPEPGPWKVLIKGEKSGPDAFQDLDPKCPDKIQSLDHMIFKSAIHENLVCFVASVVYTKTNTPTHQENYCLNQEITLFTHNKCNIDVKCIIGRNW